MDADILNEIFIMEILEKIREAVYVVNSAGIVVYLNRAAEKLEQMGRDKIIGRHIEDAYRYVEFRYNKSPCLEVLETRTPRINENIEWFTSSGNIVNCIFDTYPVFRENELVGVFQISENIAELRSVLLQYGAFERKKSFPLKTKTMNNGTIYIFDDIIGSSEVFNSAIKMSRKYAMKEFPVLISGETGTGKEMFAQSIHNSSSVAKGPFVAVNCAAIPETLLESILFGTVKGAYTGAVNSTGLFEQAAKGSIFLDEINSMDLGLQAKLLRALQEKEIRRIGDTRCRPITCRIISAINKPPHEAISSMELREDLFYRLSTGIIQIPTLRDRNNDLELMIYSFIRDFNVELNTNINKIDKGLLKLLQGYGWPGNVRELYNMIKSSMSMVGEMDEILTFSHISTYFIKRLENKNSGDIERLTTKKFVQLKDSTDAALSDSGSLYEMLNDYEVNIIMQALKETAGNLTHCSEKLGISRQNLSHKVRKYNIDVNCFKE